MNNNIYNIPVDWYKEFNNNFMANSMNNYSNKSDLATPETAFLRGNLFNSLYTPYKNYRYGEINPKNEREELLFNILKYKFSLNELNLYLDNHPNNRDYINLYNQYLIEEKKLCNEFEKKYGPLTLDYMNNGNNWAWINSPWPWEGTK